MTFFEKLDGKLYKEYRTEIQKRNYNACTYLLAIGLISATASLILQTCLYHSKTYTFSIVLCLYFVLAISFKLIFKEHIKKYNTFYLYLAETPLLLIGILMGSILDPHNPAITSLLLLLLLPLFILDNPWRLQLFVTTFIIIAIILIYISKTPELFQIDLVHILGFYVAEVLTSLFIIGERMECVVNYIESRKQSDVYEQLSEQIIESLSSAIDAKDKYTKGHSARVAKYSKEIARRAGLDENIQDDIYTMGLLHDIGKIGIPDEIINKPSKLTEKEYNKIKEHPSIGADILEHISVKPGLSLGARYHHERYDGKGYPEGISGEDIPYLARIIGVADAYDAMTSTRSYRPAMTLEHVRSEIETGKGTQFDPKYADIMLEIIDEVLKL